MVFLGFFRRFSVKRNYIISDRFVRIVQNLLLFVCLNRRSVTEMVKNGKNATSVKLALSIILRFFCIKGLKAFFWRNKDE